MGRGLQSFNQAGERTRVTCRRDLGVRVRIRSRSTSVKPNLEPELRDIRLKCVRCRQERAGRAVNATPFGFVYCLRIAAFAWYKSERFASIHSTHLISELPNFS